MLSPETRLLASNNKRPHCINWKLAFSTRSNGKQVIIKVAAGTGIYEQNLRRIFDPFFITEDKSLGLGLSIAYKIITEYGGNLSAKNSTDGAVFRIEF